MWGASFLAGTRYSGREFAITHRRMGQELLFLRAARWSAMSGVLRDN